jgi:two-component system, cell cycle response regulator
MQLLTPKQIVVRITVIISVTEFLIMLVFAVLPFTLNTYVEAILDMVTLAVCTTPLIYLWVIQPFVQARDEALAEISRLAHLDPLTHLANRRFILQHLKKIIASNVRHKQYGAALLLDLDGFKSINDVYGHDAGDAVLVEIAKRIQVVTRAEDMVGRLGGDEFIVVLNHLDVDEAGAHDKVVNISKKLIDLVKLPLEFKNSTLQVGVSIGIRLLGIDAVDAEKAISEADSAMYRAKQAGKGCAVYFGE